MSESSNSPDIPKPNPPEIGKDTIDSLKPPTQKQIRAMGEHGNSTNDLGSEVDDLKLQIQDISKPNSPSEISTDPKTRTPIPSSNEGKDKLEPGSTPIHLNEGVVTFDANGRRVGILNERVDNLVLQDIIRPPEKRAPIFVYRTREGKEIRVKKVGPNYITEGDKK